MPSFEIMYYDGQTSVAHKAVLTLQKAYWVIEPETDENGFEAIRWEVDQIERDLAFTTIYIFRYGDFPQQTIESKDENLLASLKTLYPAHRFFDKKTDFLFSQNMNIIIGLTVGFLALLFVCYWYVVPWFAEKVAANIPYSYEKSLGDMMYENTITHYQQNDSLSAKLNDFVSVIDFETEYPVQVRVVHENEMNAFAMPGGHIIVFDQLLKKIKTKDELAALLAHEVAHVHYRHSLKSIFRSLSGYLIISLIFNDINGISAVLADNSNMLVNLGYSRSLESQADEKAAEVLRKNGLKMEGLVDLFTLLSEGNKDAEYLKLLSTHPLTGDRIQFAKQMASSQKTVPENVVVQQKWEVIQSEKVK